MAYCKNNAPELKRIILEKMCNGQSLKKILDLDKRKPQGKRIMPARITVYGWLNPHTDYYDADFSFNYNNALQERADYMVDEIAIIADDQEGDTYTNADGVEVTNHNVIQRSRLRVDTRKWIAARMRPKKYGDSQQIKHTDGDGEPLKINAIFTTDFLENVLPNKSTEENSDPGETD
jgi:hypothetical protein